MPIHDGRDVESKRWASAVAPGILLAIVEFVGDIRSVVGIENRRPIGCVPNLGAKHPNNAVLGSVGGYSWGSGYPSEGIAATCFEREPSVLYFKFTKCIAVAKHIKIMVPVGH